MELEQQYYNKFLPFIVDYYKDTLKDAKPGHCMKITGFAFHELKKLIPMLRPVNKDMQVYIISEEVTGPDFAHPNKIVESFVTRTSFHYSLLYRRTIAHHRKIPLEMLHSSCWM